MFEITEEMKQAAQQAKKDKIAYAKEHLDLDWGDDEKHWKSLGKLYNVRLPAYYHSSEETKYARRLFKKLGGDMNEYLEYSGCRTLKELVSLNPTHNAVAFCGFILEWWHEKQTETIEFEDDGYA